MEQKMSTTPKTPPADAPVGQLAKAFANKSLPLSVLRSRAGCYVGTADDDGPCSRESVEYWSDSQDAESALQSGSWTQRERP